MKLMLIGSDKVYAIENHYVKHLRELGVDVQTFCAQTIFYDYYYKNLANKLLFKAGLSGIHTEINKQFKEEATKFRPDLIWVFKGMEIFPASLKWAREKNTILLNYNPDNPFIFTGSGSGNKNVAQSIDLYHLHFTYNLEIKEKLQKEYNAKTFFLPFGYDVDESIISDCEKEEEIVRACFLGNPDKQRAEFIMDLARHGVEIDLYGNNWAGFLNHDLIRIFPPVYNSDFWKTLYRYRVQLNLMRIHNENSHNMRSFEVPGVGGIQLAPDTPEHREFFVPGKEIFLFTGVDDCTKQLHQLLALSQQEAAAIRKQARHRSVQAEYSYRGRAQQALGIMNQLMNE